MDRWKSRGGKSQRREEQKRDQRRERVRRKKMPRCAKGSGARKVAKSQNTVFFQWFVAQQAREVGSLKRRVRSHVVRWEMEKCTQWWREAHVEVKMYKTHHARTTFGSWHVEKVHAVRARSTFPKSKCTKHTMLGPLLEVDTSKECTPLWREAHFQVKMYKAHHARTTFASWHVEKVHAVVARITFWSQKCKKLTGTEHFWTFRCRFAPGLCTWSKVSKT